MHLPKVILKYLPVKQVIDYNFQINIAEKELIVNLYTSNSMSVS